MNIEEFKQPSLIPTGAKTFETTKFEQIYRPTLSGGNIDEIKNLI